MKRRINSLLLVLTAFIWGVAFVAQSKGGDSIGPLTFASIRFLMAPLVLLPVILIGDAKRKKHPVPPVPAADGSLPETDPVKARRIWIKGGVLCGALLILASILQQLGINLGTPVGKAGFLTACYIVFVPLLGILFRRKCPWTVLIATGMTLVGLYLLCLGGGSFDLQLSDGLLILCAVTFALQIIVIDRYAPRLTEADTIKLSAVQFLTAGVLGLIPMFIFEVFLPEGGIAAWASNFGSLDAWIPLLYAGILSSAVGYTLQCVGQRGVNPTVASLLMSLESVFAVLAGWMLLHERLSAREFIGCAVVFAAVVLAQIPAPKLKKKK